MRYYLVTCLTKKNGSLDLKNTLTCYHREFEPKRFIDTMREEQSLGRVVILNAMRTSRRQFNLWKEEK
jgi:hypothetical protein